MRVPRRAGSFGRRTSAREEEGAVEREREREEEGGERERERRRAARAARSARQQPGAGLLVHAWSHPRTSFSFEPRRIRATVSAVESVCTVIVSPSPFATSSGRSVPKFWRNWIDISLPFFEQASSPSKPIDVATL